jgi:hypothetical protein
MARFNSQISIVAAVFGLATLVHAPPAHADGIKFNLVEVPGELTPEVRNAYFTAANRWSSLLEDIGYTINLRIGYSPIGSNILGSAGSNLNSFSYTDFRNALAAHQTSTEDAQAVSSLQSGSSFAMLINGTSNNPNGVGSRTPYLDNDGDANNSTIRMTTANAQALGLPTTYGTGDNAFDGLITLSSLVAFDFDQSDGITPGTYDFTGIVEHEIGHTLGFISGVNRLDDLNGVNSYLRDDELPVVAPIDLFRYTDLSANTTAAGLTGTPGIPAFTLGTYSPDFTPLDGTIDPVRQYFSLDNGATVLAESSTGRNFGDGRQASHWKDNSDLGIMDPTSTLGDLQHFSTNDLRLFDILGYTLRPGALESVAAPEPGSRSLIFATGILFIGQRFRRKKMLLIKP